MTIPAAGVITFFRFQTKTDQVWTRKFLVPINALIEALITHRKNQNICTIWLCPELGPEEPIFNKKIHLSCKDLAVF